MMIVLCGRNGAGKTTVARRLIEGYGYTKFPSVTTRQPRPSDLPGEYECVSPEEFARRKREGVFAWDVQHAGASYGTEREPLRTALVQREARWLDILVPSATNKHAEYAKEAGVKTYGVKQGVFYFYLWVASEEVLRERLMQRGESRAEAYLKLRASRGFDKEVREINQKDDRFSTVDSEHCSVEQTVQEILSVLKGWGG